jgi:hypothetical protein
MADCNSTLLGDPDADCTDPQAMSRRLYRVASLLISTSRELSAMSVEWPAGPPNAPQVDACQQIIQICNQTIQAANAILNHH